MVTPGNRTGYSILAAGVVLGLFFAWQNDNDIKEVNRSQTKFIIEQCKRDTNRNEIVIDSLEGAKRRAIITYRDDPFLGQLEVDRIQRQINNFKNSPPCELP